MDNFDTLNGKLIGLFFDRSTHLFCMLCTKNSNDTVHTNDQKLEMERNTKIHPCIMTAKYVSKHSH